jgi:hypothetical protein
MWGTVGLRSFELENDPEPTSYFFDDPANAAQLRISTFATNYYILHVDKSYKCKSNSRGLSSVHQFFD